MKNVVMGFLGLMLILTGCQPVPYSSRAVATSTPAATPVLPSATATPSPTPAGPEVVVTHPELEVISPENINRLEQVASWGEGKIYDYAVSPDKSMIAVSTARGIYLYDSITLDEILYYQIISNQTQTNVTKLNFSDDNQFILFAVGDQIEIFEIVIKSVIDSLYLEINGRIITKISLGSDHKSLSVQSTGLLPNCEIGGGTVQLYTKAHSGWQLDYFRSVCGALTTTYTYSNDFYSFSLFNDKSVEIFHVDTGELEFWQVKSKEEWPGRTFYTVSPDEKYLAAYSDQDNLPLTQIFDAKNFKLVKTVNTERLELLNSDKNGQVVWVDPSDEEDSEAISRCNISAHRLLAYELVKKGDFITYMVQMGFLPYRLEIWNTASCTLITKVGTYYDRAPVFNPTGTLLVIPERLEMHVWDGKTGNLRYTIQNEEANLRDRVDPVIFSATGKYIVTGIMAQSETNYAFDYIANQINIFDAETGSLIKSITPGLDTITAIQPGLDDDTLLILEDDQVHIWDIQTGMEIPPVAGDSLVQNDSGTRSWVGQENRISLMDHMTGMEIASYKIPETTFVDQPYQIDENHILIGIRNEMYRSEFLSLDTTSGEMIRQGDLFPGEKITQVDEGLFYTVCADGLIVVRDSRTLQILKKISTFQSIKGQDTSLMDSKTAWEMKWGQGASRSMSITFFPNMDLFYVSNSAGMFFGDMATGEIVGQLDLNYSFQGLMTFSPDGRLIAVVGDDGIIRLWGVKAEE
jgi:WD40 repeat protein